MHIIGAFKAYILRLSDSKPGF